VLNGISSAEDVETCAVNPLSSTRVTDYHELNTANNKTWWVLPKNTTKATYDLSDRSKLISSSNTEIKAGDVNAEFGNILQSTQTVDSGFGTHAVTTVKDYFPHDDTNWWVNKLERQTVTTSALSGSTPVAYNSTLDSQREVTTHYTWTTERQPDVVSTSVTQGSGKSVSVDTDYSRYGLPRIVTTSSAGETSRVVTTGYSSDGYFAESVTQENADNSALNQTVTSSINPIHGQPDWVEDANGNRTYTYYDAFGRVERVEADGVPTAYKRYYWCDTVVGSSCDSNTVYKLATFQAGSPTVYEHKDMFNRSLLAETVGFDGTSLYAYTTVNALGQKLFESVPSTNRSTTLGTHYNSYDALGRLTSRTTHNAGGTLLVEYRYDGHKTYIQAGDMPEMSRTHSGTGQLMQTTDSLDGVTQYAYDGMGNPIVMRDAKGNDITAQYNALGQKQWVNDPNMGQKTFTYTGFGEVHTELDANGNTTRYVYDNLGRLIERQVKNISETYFNTEATFVFDTALQDDSGQCLGMPASEHKTGENAERYYGYDDKCRLVRQTDVINGESFNLLTHIDGNYGRVKGKTFPNELTIAYTYNNHGYLHRTYNPSNNYIYREIDGMDEWGQWDEARLGNNVLQIDRNYIEASGQMLSSALYRNNRNTLLQAVDYDVDRYGNLQQMYVDNYNGSEVVHSDEDYQYDSLHRLTQSTRSINGVTLPEINYDYDKVGNFKFKSDFSTAANDAYTYGESSRTHSSNAGPNAVRSVALANNGGTRSYQYDNNGNLITDQLDGSTLRTIDYNAFNKPTLITVNGGRKLSPTDSANTGSSTTEFFYGANQMRYKQVKNANGEQETTLYIGKAYEEVRSINKTVKKVFLDDIAQITETITASGSEHRIGFFHKDRLGSTIAIVDDNGNVMEARSFDAFGKPRKEDLSDKGVAAIGSELYKRGFTDHEHLDDSQLIHMNGRAYDYNLGRFLSVDPFIQEPGNSQSMNPYSYIMNNPLAGPDPSGYRSICGKNNSKGCTIIDVNGSSGSYFLGKAKTKNGKTVQIAVHVKPGVEAENIGDLKESDILSVAITNGEAALIVSTQGGTEAKLVVAGGSSSAATPSGNHIPCSGDCHPVSNSVPDFAGALDRLASDIGEVFSLDNIQTGLDAVGMAPGVGIVADVLNAGISTLRGNFGDAAMSLGAAVPGAGQFIASAKISQKMGRVVKEYDIVQYRPSNSPLENHHGVLDIWAKHNIPGYVSRGSNTVTMALSKANHDATKVIYRNWLKANYGKPVGAKVNWTKVSARDMQSLTESMFDAAKAPGSARRDYYRALNEYMYGGN
jgi:RHS repeat-associated protein